MSEKNIRETGDDARVRLFHASLVWPLQLEPLAADRAHGCHWEAFEACQEH